MQQSLSQIVAAMTPMPAWLGFSARYKDESDRGPMGGSNGMTWQRSRIRLDSDNRAFWTGGAEGKLNIHKCGDCGGFIHPPRAFCRHCQSENVAPFAVSGTGVIDTYTVNYQKWAPDMDVPFVIARVRLDDAPDVFLTTNIVGCPVDEVDIDQSVQVTFEEQDGIWYPLFEKVG